MPLTPEEKTLKARIAVHASWANTADRTARTEPARRARMAKFEEEARRRHPDADEATIAKVTDHLKSEHFARLSYLAAKKRRQAANPRHDDS